MACSHHNKPIDPPHPPSLTTLLLLPQLAMRAFFDSMDANGDGVLQLEGTAHRACQPIAARHSRLGLGAFWLHTAWPHTAWPHTAAARIVRYCWLTAALLFGFCAYFCFLWGRAELQDGISTWWTSREGDTADATAAAPAAPAACAAPAAPAAATGAGAGADAADGDADAAAADNADNSAAGGAEAACLTPADVRQVCTHSHSPTRSGFTY